MKKPVLHESGIDVDSLYRNLAVSKFNVVRMLVYVRVQLALAQMGYVTCMRVANNIFLEAQPMQCD